MLNTHKLSASFPIVDNIICILWKKHYNRIFRINSRRLHFETGVVSKPFSNPFLATLKVTHMFDIDKIFDMFDIDKILSVSKVWPKTCKGGSHLKRNSDWIFLKFSISFFNRKYPKESYQKSVSDIKAQVNSILVPCIVIQTQHQTIPKFKLVQFLVFCFHNQVVPLLLTWFKFNPNSNNHMSSKARVKLLIYSQSSDTL